MQGILYISHGSRIPEATAEAFYCISSVREQTDFALQEICFLELADPDLEQGVDTLVSRGASRIAVVPVLLLSAGHYYHDIPGEINRLMAIYPDIEFTYGRPLGVQEDFIDVLIERIAETEKPVGPSVKILLVGRGSRNPQTKEDIETIGKKLQSRAGIPVDICFLAACEPSFEQCLNAVSKADLKQVYIVPYLWFTGVLMRYIDEKMRDAANTDPVPGPDVILCRQLGAHPAMCEALKKRVYEALDRKMPSPA
ncbi:sirohydrochlorin chelatase [Lentibacillus amyloliquefaciens]|uniref:Sirohydrochlorin ferrochelatase n=1 Tax=Lentibacillus amyloliquefaciens TaxID=1472767 RepID=A0A0U4DUH5_9BACI|nr:sirohydrochlorin chelatase [Lentibacillus amyloliquefaciens]ALX49032.1 sirohydrochlorin ferrochelatase [Lentibacillus amyloliquefaciens]